jgi:SAM-dependent methyltransferase
MKIRDSGMPDEAYWESLFDVPLIISRLGIDRFHDVAELGCGYGTFTIPIAKVISGTVYTFDVDPAMIARTKERAGVLRIICENRDVIESGFALEVDAVLLFNILHTEQPIRLLELAGAAGREVLVVHWRFGETPRGPSLDIRPKPEQIVEWGREAGLKPSGETIDLPPWHYGLRLKRLPRPRNQRSRGHCSSE